jgi:hypothetical protein
MLLISEAPLNHAMMTLRELHFYPWTLIFSIKGSYLPCFVLMAWRMHLSCVDANLIILMVRSRVVTTPKTLFGITYSLKLRNAITLCFKLSMQIFTN